MKLSVSRISSLSLTPDPKVHVAYGILDTDKSTFELRRVSYDSEATCKAITWFPPWMSHVLQGASNASPLWDSRV